MGQLITQTIGAKRGSNNIVKSKKRKRGVGFTNREPLVCCEFASLQRCIGVEIGKEFTHHGLQKQMVECTYETVTVNTATYGGPKFVEEVADERIAMSKKIVRDITRVITELQSHRSRIIKGIK